MAVEEPKKLKIAVVGVGLGGGAVGAFLKSVPNVDVQLYERSVVHRQVGAWIGVTPAGQLLLEEICGEEAVDSISTRMYGAPAIKHWKTGEIKVPTTPLPDGITHEEKVRRRGQADTIRQDLHRIIIDQIPKGTIHTGKRGVSFKVDEDKVTVDFQDGTSVEADLLIVSDGINSKLRQHVYPDNVPKYLPYLEHMEVFDKAELKKTIPDLPNGSTCYFKDDTMVFLGDVGCGRYSIIAVLPANPEDTKTLGWAHGAEPTRLEHLRDHLKEWDPLITNILKHSKNLGLFPPARGFWLKSLIYQDRVCFVGDAAHPTGGAFSAGCSFAFEDGKTLCLALNHVYNEAGSWSLPVLKRALHLYDETRTPHVIRIFKALAEDAPLDETENEIKNEMTWLTNIDCDSEFKKTLARFDNLQISNGNVPTQLNDASETNVLLGSMTDKMVAPRGAFQAEELSI
ncbi:hypothetical protein BP6252_11331 [Coleophoma cylindrospora]|uniref:FAD-binding domain-containing protein n=1 Tax=Coleophoma cylindrospora TaxID=1849047 RepID=A0A3D8QPN5_9HELO|nr:hypothetical protein BP6252_11331 [Coleophoma cylindrospora]